MQDSAMTDPNKSVFISYRRSTSQDLARSIFMDLRANGWDAFFDVNTIDSGMFDRIILNQIAARAHFVLVLSPGALKRCANEGDWLRREIEEAMRLDRNLVPVMKEGFSFEEEMQFLPDSMKDLPRFNGLRVPHDYFDEAMEKLRNRYLRQPFYGEVVPTPTNEVPIVEQRIAEAAQQLPEEGMNVEGYFNRGSTRKDKGDFDGAIADYSEAIRLNPQYALAHNSRGSARKDKGDLDGAIADYSEAIRLNPQYATAYYNRANARKDKGDLDGAIADYSELLVLKPRYASAYYSRGDARKNKGDFDGAIADYSEAIRLDPQYIVAYHNRGSARYDKGDLEGAVAGYHEALKVNPHYAIAHWGLGNCYYDLRRFSEALREYKLYLKFAGANPSEFVARRVKELKAMLGQK